MIISSVFGAQIGSIVSQKTDVNNLRSLLALMFLMVSITMLVNLLVHPDALYRFEIIK